MFERLWSELRFRTRAIIRRAAVERELDDELRFHVEQETEKHRLAGTPPQDALRLARLTFGGMTRIKDDARDARGVGVVDQVRQDLHYALRGIRRRPLFASVVVITLALGIGVNAAMFGILDRTLFRAPQFLIDPAAVNRVYAEWSESDGTRNPARTVEYPRLADLTRWSQSVSQIAGFAYRTAGIGEGDQTKDLQVAAVTASFFNFFDARPVLGRFFGANEDIPPAGDPVAVLSYAYWQSQYEGRRDVLGVPIKIGASSYKIIGVAPRGFEGTSDYHPAVAFIPATAYGASMRPSYFRRYSWDYLEILVRRKPGVTIDAANADLTNALLRSWNAERAINPSTPPADLVRPRAFAAPIQLARGPMAGPEAKVGVWIGVVAFIVLLTACANVANLLLAGAVVRRREMVVRRAIGGTSSRLIQQLLTETLVLAGLATTAGLLGAQIGAGALRRLLVDTTDSWPIVTDARTIGFAVALTAVSALLCGILPALHVGRIDLAGSLRAGTRSGGYRQSATRVTLLVFQTAFSVVLLVGAGLFVRSLQKVRSVRLGYDVEPLVYVSTTMRGVKLKAPEMATLSERLLQEARSVPGIRSATFIVTIPFLGGERHNLYVAGVDSVKQFGRFMLQAGSPEYFATMGTRIVGGRALSPTDRAGTPLVAVVSAAMADVLWKGENAIGKCFRIEADTAPCTTVVGIAENIKTRDMLAGGEFMYYLPLEQYFATIGSPDGAQLIVRTPTSAARYVETIRARLQRAMPGASYVTAMPFRDIVDPTFRSWASGSRMFVMLGGLALMIAAIGLYAAIAFAVAQRTQEIGVRIALGARVDEIVRFVVGDGIRVTLAGVAVGTLIGLVASRQIGGLLFDEPPTDPLVYGTVAGVLIIVSVLASAIPAVGAARVDPNEALRAE